MIDNFSFLFWDNNLDFDNFDIFSQTDRPTDTLTKIGIEASGPELRK